MTQTTSLTALQASIVSTYPATNAVTIGAFVDEGSTTIPGSTVYYTNNGTTFDTARFSFLAGEWVVSAFPGYNRAVVLPSRGDASLPGAVIAFTTTERYIELLVEAPSSSASDGLWLRVNGEYGSATVINLRTDGTHPPASRTLIPVTFPTAATRTVEVITTFGDGQLGGVRALSAPVAVTHGLKCMVHGDSFAEPMARDFQDYSGQSDTRSTAIGATGFVNDAGGTKPTAMARVQEDVIAAAPDVIWELNGLNDREYYGTRASYTALVTSWLDQVVTALPSVVIFMTGPMCPNEYLSTTIEMIDMLEAKRSAAALYPRNVCFIDNLTNPWVTGNGHVGSTTGIGNADWVTSGDGTHPTVLGQRYIVGRIAAAALAAIPAFLSAMGWSAVTPATATWTLTTPSGGTWTLTAPASGSWL